MRRFLAIDPGVKACGMAWRYDEKEIFTDTCRADSFRFFYRNSALRKSWEFAVLEIANGYGPNIKAAFALAEARGRIIEACESAGLTVIRVNVATWQSAVLAKQKVKGDSKKRSLEAARSVGVETDDHNIADAVNILIYSELNELGAEE